MTPFWHMVVRLYLLIPHSKLEAHLFMALHHRFAWWMPGAFAFGLMPVTVFGIWILEHMFGEFKWFKAERLYQWALRETRKYSYYSVWIVYGIWIPLPWPRLATLIWAVSLYRIIKNVRRKRQIRLAHQAKFDEGVNCSRLRFH